MSRHLHLHLHLGSGPSTPAAQRHPPAAQRQPPRLTAAALAAAAAAASAHGHPPTASPNAAAAAARARLPPAASTATAATAAAARPAFIAHDALPAAHRGQSAAAPAAGMRNGDGRGGSGGGSARSLSALAAATATSVAAAAAAMAGEAVRPAAAPAPRPQPQPPSSAAAATLAPDSPPLRPLPRWHHSRSPSPPIHPALRLADGESDDESTPPSPIDRSPSADQSPSAWSLHSSPLPPLREALHSCLSFEDEAVRHQPRIGATAGAGAAGATAGSAAQTAAADGQSGSDSMESVDTPLPAAPPRPILKNRCGGGDQCRSQGCSCSAPKLRTVREATAFAAPMKAGRSDRSAATASAAGHGSAVATPSAPASASASIRWAPKHSLRAAAVFQPTASGSPSPFNFNREQRMQKKREYRRELREADEVQLLEARRLADGLAQREAAAAAQSDAAQSAAVERRLQLADANMRALEGISQANPVWRAAVQQSRAQPPKPRPMDIDDNGGSKNGEDRDREAASPAASFSFSASDLSAADRSSSPPHTDVSATLTAGAAADAASAPSRLAPPTSATSSLPDASSTSPQELQLHRPQLRTDESGRAAEPPSSSLHLHPVAIVSQSQTEVAERRAAGAAPERSDREEMNQQPLRPASHRQRQPPSQPAEQKPIAVPAAAPVRQREAQPHRRHKPNQQMQQQQSTKQRQEPQFRMRVEDAMEIDDDDEDNDDDDGGDPSPPPSSSSFFPSALSSLSGRQLQPQSELLGRGPLTLRASAPASLRPSVPPQPPRRLTFTSLRQVDEADLRRIGKKKRGRPQWQPQFQQPRARSPPPQSGAAVMSRAGVPVRSPSRPADRFEEVEEIESWPESKRAKRFKAQNSGSGGGGGGGRGGPVRRISHIAPPLPLTPTSFAHSGRQKQQPSAMAASSPEGGNEFRSALPSQPIASPSASAYPPLHRSAAIVDVCQPLQPQISGQSTQLSGSADPSHSSLSGSSATKAIQGASHEQSLAAQAHLIPQQQRQQWQAFIMAQHQQQQQQQQQQSALATAPPTTTPVQSQQQRQPPQFQQQAAAAAPPPSSPLSPTSPPPAYRPFVLRLQAEGGGPLLFACADCGAEFDRRWWRRHMVAHFKANHAHIAEQIQRSQEIEERQRQSAASVSPLFGSRAHPASAPQGSSAMLTPGQPHQSASAQQQQQHPPSLPRGHAAPRPAPAHTSRRPLPVPAAALSLTRSAVQAQPAAVRAAPVTAHPAENQRQPAFSQQQPTGSRGVQTAVPIPQIPPPQLSAAHPQQSGNSSRPVALTAPLRRPAAPQTAASAAFPPPAPAPASAPVARLAATASFSGSSSAAAAAAVSSIPLTATVRPSMQRRADGSFRCSAPGCGQIYSRNCKQYQLRHHEQTAHAQPDRTVGGALAAAFGRGGGSSAASGPAPNPAAAVGSSTTAAGVLSGGARWHAQTRSL